MTPSEYLQKRQQIKSECLSLLEKVRERHSDYTFFQSVDSDYIIMRKIIGKSKFYREDKTFFYVDIVSQEKIHYEELKYL